LEKFSCEQKVVVMVIIIPKIPKKFPFLDVSGDDKPLKANINKIPDTRNNKAEKLEDIIFYFSSSFYTLQAFFE